MRLSIVAMLTAVLALFAATAQAQVVVAKNFRHYPQGQWQQEMTGYRDGKALGPPVTSTNCSGPLDTKASAAMLDAAKGGSAMCTSKTLTDQPQLLEYETSCNMGGGVQTIHVQLRAIDDRTMMSETRSRMAGGPETLLKSKVTYLGACPASMAAVQKPSAADCAEIADMQKRNEGAKADGSMCAQMPPQYRAQCESQIAAGTKMMAALEAQCK